jgi:Ca2+-binding EF-hand superfamily protein
MLGLLQKFDLWEENGDGHLTAAELGKAEPITGYPPEKIVAFYDKDSDARISLKEAQDGLSRSDEAERATHQ